MKRCCDSNDGPTLPRGARTWSRRDLLELALRGAGAAALTPSLLGLLTRHALAQQAKATSKKLVLLWLDGGPSQLDTFDPKPGAATAGPVGAIPTDVKGWMLSQHFPLLAKRAEHLAMVRSMTSKEGSHARARELLHSGYTPNPAVAFPTLGSIVAHEVGDLDADLPAFVQIAGLPGSSGHLGVASRPFVVASATKKIDNLGPKGGGERPRVESRSNMLDVLEKSFSAEGGDRASEANAVQRRRARRLMESKLLVAFDLEKEDEGTRKRYGEAAFGQGVLLARRLLENGVAAVEVVLDGWDTHVNNFKRTADLCRDLDPAFSALIDDLRERSLLADTLVVCMGEFGRTPTIGANDGRDHWPNNYCVALAGGGVKGGTVVGETDERGDSIVKDPVQVADLFATIARVLRMDRDKVFLKDSRRPVKLVDPNGVVVEQLLS